MEYRILRKDQDGFIIYMKNLKLSKDQKGHSGWINRIYSGYYR